MLFPALLKSSLFQLTLPSPNAVIYFLRLAFLKVLSPVTLGQRRSQKKSTSYDDTSWKSKESSFSLNNFIEV